MIRGIRAVLAASSLVVVLAACVSAVEMSSDSSQHRVSVAASVSGATGVAHSAHGEVPASDQNSQLSYQTVSQAALAIEQKKGPEAALDYLDKQILNFPSVSGICHAVAHDIGHASLDHFGGVVAKALAVRNDVCGGGYVHGVVEQALAGSTDIAHDLLRVCAPNQDGSCWHGVGHGVMFATKYNLGRTLKLCRSAPSIRLAIRCSEGVFMQLFTLDDGIGHAAGQGFVLPAPTSAARTCAKTPSTFADTCWFYSTTVWLQLHPDDWKGLVTWCRSQSGVDAKSSCLRGVGSRLVKYHPDKISFGANICSRVGERYVTDCLRGMGSYWSVNWKGKKEQSDVCRHIDDSDLASRCRKALA